ncbi:DUF7009 family protein [Pseudozobellia thermophila]|uniref:Uncharacterized protein n=1 Tax=Pseudozobellia thermophila TaxID=192903 RepID=A0A1M6FSG5_9FLAO|nr:hypothetical protein [Pseudozobellia thermophila]SHJ00559.1 hypothetical protein SAMN04488513_102534 [Pseudozobellia thermophila]
MKIRIRGNSVRYRLTKTEVATFCQTGHYTETTLFNTQKLVYELRSKKNIAGLQADFVDNTITVFVPEKEADTWADSPKVGFKNEYKLDTGGVLSLLVEKDFVCLDERDEDESDNYPNPLAE